MPSHPRAREKGGKGRETYKLNIKAVLLIPLRKNKSKCTVPEHCGLRCGNVLCIELLLIQSDQV